MFVEKRKFKNSKGNNLSAIYEGEDRNAPVVVLCHGFGSSKDSESNSHLAQKLVESGLNVYRFDFTGSGESGGSFDECTPSHGLNDLKSAVDDLGSNKIALYGNSYGGFIALIYASENPILALGLKAPVSDYLDVETRKSKDNLGLTDAKKEIFLKELKDIDVYKLARKITAPTLIVHGGADEIVPFKQSERLLKSLSGEKRLSVIHGATHRMRGPAMEDAHNQLTEFFIGKLL